MSADHLEINNLSHNYGSSALDGFSLNSIDLSLSRGQLLGLLGPSGCGKTTLLRLIAGFETPSKGSISVNGNIISSPSFVLPPERRDIGMVFQDYALFPHLDVWRNMCFGLRNTKQDIQRAKWLLELLDLYPFRNRYPHELSGGQKQRLALGRALSPGTSLVVLDEPFCSLDVEVRHRLRNELCAVLSSCSATGILVTHDPQEALGICDLVAVMNEGSLHQCSSPEDMLYNPATDFISKFVFQNNILHVNYLNGEITTPFGSVIVQPHLLKSNPTTLTVDEFSFEIKANNSGTALVKSREFKGSHWIIRIQYENESLRALLSLDTDIKPGDRCDITFVSGKYGFLFPGSVSCILQSK